MRSMRGERESHAPPRRCSTRVMIVSVGVALRRRSRVWFFGFAGSSLPGA